MEFTNFIIPLVLLFIVPFVITAIFSVCFKRLLPAKIHNYLLGPVTLLGLYIWAVPMELGFYEFFRSIL